MSVSNLTNTSWCLKGDEELVLNNDFSYAINFTSKSTNFTQFIFSQSSHGLFYNNTQVYEKGYYEDWLDWDYRFITITGGNDVQNPSLIKWLEANAVLVPNDLTNTKWNLGNNITFEIASYDFKGTYAINFKTGGNVSHTALSLVYESNTNKVKYDSTSVWEDDETPWMDDSSNSQITITGGTDVTNSNLIKWLCLNGTYVNLFTYDLTQLQLSAGTHVVQVRARAQGYRDSNFSNTITYTKKVNNIHIKITGSNGYLLGFSLNEDVGHRQTQQVYEESSTPRSRSFTYNNVYDLVLSGSGYGDLKIGTTEGASDIHHEEHVTPISGWDSNITRYLQDGCYVSWQVGQYD